MLIPLRILAMLAVLAVALLHAPPGRAAENPAPPGASRLLDSGERLATEISKVTGCAISPILGLSVLGAYTYYTTPRQERGSLPWHASPRFWTPLLVILAGIILKDSAKVTLPKLLMVPLDAAETLLEKNTTAALALVVLLTSLTGQGLDHLQLPGLTFSPSLAATAHAAAILPRTAPDLAGMLELGLLILFVLVIYTVVWVVSHSVNVLIMLCPFSTIDLLLTLGKNSLIALLLGASLLHPLAGLLVALLIILVSFLLFSWSLRFVFFGTLLSLDLLRGPGATPPADGSAIPAFAYRDLPGVPAMSYGHLRRLDDTLVFSYHPSLLLRTRTVTLRDGCAAYSLARGRLSPLLVSNCGTSGKFATLCRFRPSANSHEQRIVDILGLRGVRNAASGRTLRDGLDWLRAQFGGRSKQTCP